MSKKLFIFVLAIFILPSVSASVYYWDTFDRANSATLGGNWTEPVPTQDGWYIRDSHAEANTTERGYAENTLPGQKDVLSIQLLGGWGGSAGTGLEWQISKVGTQAGLHWFRFTNANTLTVKKSAPAMCGTGAEAFASGDYIQYNASDNDVWWYKNATGVWQNLCDYGVVDTNATGFIDSNTKDITIDNWCNADLGSECIESYSPLAPIQWNFSITANDLYDNSAITNFTANVTFNGTTVEYSTTNGTIITNILSLNTNPVNVTAGSNQNGGYFTNRYENRNISTANLSSTLFQAQVFFQATEIITGTNITPFTITATNGKNSNGSTPFLYVRASQTHNFTFNRTSWFSSSLAATVTALSNQTLNLTAYQLILNITAVNSTGAITSFNATINSTSYENTTTTTNGVVWTPWINETLNITIRAAQNTETSTIFSLSSYTLPATVNVSVTLLSYNTFNLTFYNETSDLQLTANITLQVISSVYSANYTVTNGYVNISFLTPADYELIYFYDPDVPREYYVTLSEGSFNNLRLYTIDEDISDFYLPVAKDGNLQACGNTTVGLLRYYVSINGYRTVEMAKTDTNGQAVLRVQPNIVNYKLLFDGSCGTFVTDPQKFTSSSNSFTVSNAQSPLTSISEIGNVAQSFIFDNATNTFVFTWTDTQNLVSAGCLKVTKWLLGTMTVVNNNCSASASGSLIYTVTDTNQTRYVAQSQLNTTTTFSTYTDFLEESFQNSWQTWGLTGVFLTLLVVLAFSLMSLGSPEATVISGVAAIGIMGMFGVIAHNFTVLVGMLICVVIIIYKTRGT